MRRAFVVALALAAAFAAGCTAKYADGVRKTKCVGWIHSSPAGALLYLNKNYVGRTPYKYTAMNDGDSSAHFIAPALSEIMARKRGYDDEVETITVANCYKTLNIENVGVREQVKTYTGSITLYMDERENLAEKEYGNVLIGAMPEEPDAEIYINDNLIGNGKTSLLKLPAGSYVLKIRKPGYKVYARVISVLADNDLTITANLEKGAGPGDEASSAMQADKVQLSQAGVETELEEDGVPGSIGGKGDDLDAVPPAGADRQAQQD